MDVAPVVVTQHVNPEPFAAAARARTETEIHLFQCAVPTLDREPNGKLLLD
jgi:hypothetical protein